MANAGLAGIGPMRDLTALIALLAGIFLIFAFRCVISSTIGAVAALATAASLGFHTQIAGAIAVARTWLVAAPRRPTPPEGRARSGGAPGSRAVCT